MNISNNYNNRINFMQLNIILKNVFLYNNNYFFIKIFIIQIIKIDNIFRKIIFDDFIIIDSRFSINYIFIFIKFFFFV